jgi:hypothetical protein
MGEAQACGRHRPGSLGIENSVRFNKIVMFYNSCSVYNKAVTDCDESDVRKKRHYQ